MINDKYSNEKSNVKNLKLSLLLTFLSTVKKVL